MSVIIPDRMTAEISGPFLVLLLGMKPHKPLRFWTWLPMAHAMQGMVKELYASESGSGFLGHTNLGMFTMVQYWESFEQLEAYAAGPGQERFPGWRPASERELRAEKPAVGFWHETYLVDDGAYETLYSGMPAHGLGKCGKLVPAAGEKIDARGRLLSHLT